MRPKLLAFCALLAFVLALAVPAYAQPSTPADAHSAVPLPMGSSSGRDEEPVTSEPSQETTRAALRSDVERALGGLRRAERDAIALAFGQGLTHEEAARILGCPLGTLKTNVTRGMEKLEKELAAWRETG